MRTQKEINHYLQDTTIKNARNLLDIESCINNNNLHLPNNVIIHENGISFAEFYKWFENRCLKEGDICTTTLGTVFIYQSITVSNFCGSYVSVDIKDILNIHYNSFPEDCCRLATEEEKQKLFDAIRANGYKWNAKAKILEKLNVPKFKVGDKIKYRSGTLTYRVVKITEDSYILDNLCSISISIEHMYDLVHDKFDIFTLKPFDKVLVRDCNYEQWMTAVYSHKQDNHFIASGHFKQCIPYKGNEHLLGTSNDCDDFYNTWE